MTRTSTMQLISAPHRDEYDDDYLYGERRAAIFLEDLRKLKSSSDCVMLSLGSIVETREWTLTRLQGIDSRLKNMLKYLEVKHLLPVQRLCFPQMNLAAYPLLCVAPENSGKSWAHLLYIVCRSITAIPISRTNEIIDSTNKPTSTFESDQTKKVSTDLPNEVLEAIDQENFDFNKLGDLAIAAEASSPGIDLNPDDYITQPRYIIICASQDKVDNLGIQVDEMKQAAFGTRHEDLPPRVRTINVHQDEEKLALRCNQGEILVATPGALLKCVKLDLVTFSKCKMLIFDELDLTLQLHNQTIREIIKFYLVQTESTERSDANTTGETSCIVYMFARKWTELVKNFTFTVFLNQTIIFGSMLEASVYINLRYDLEFTSETNKILKQIVSIASDVIGSQKTGVLCKSDEDAQLVADYLQFNSLKVILIDKTFRESFSNDVIVVIPDSVLEHAVQSYSDLDHIIHYSMADSMQIFNLRFRLIYQNIREMKKNLKTTLFIGSQLNARLAKELYDVITRSNTTLNSTKLELRDFISHKMNTICWRWASHGICRVDKYCFFKHSMIESDNCKKPTQFPTRGQIKITLTHLVSPNEFYFWFEAHRNRDSMIPDWTNIDNSGTEYMRQLQTKLDSLKDTPNYSVPFRLIKKGKVYGIYLPQETRVDRVLLLEEPRKVNQEGCSRKLAPSLLKFYEKLDYGEQYEVLKIDYGTKIHAFLHNIFELPEELASIPAQCHRGFLIGFKPTENEPNWLYQAKRHFYQEVCAENLYEITVWCRLHSNDCFWFENMVVTRKLANLEGNRMIKIEPQRELISAGLAESIKTEPSYLRPSERLTTLSKWHVNQSAALVSFAFLPKDKNHLDIFVLYTHEDNGHIMVRQEKFNKQLIRLEADLLEEYNEGKLEPLNYYAQGIYCLARIVENNDPANPVYTINRCTIREIRRNSEVPSNTNVTFAVRCLDHGDLFHVSKEDLYLAKADHIRRLPFQAIKCKLADIKLEFFEDQKAKVEFKELIYNYTRDEDNEYITLKCISNKEGALYLYVPTGNEEVYKPLINILEEKHKLRAFNDNDQEQRKSIKFAKERDVTGMHIEDYLSENLIIEILDDMIREELSKVGVESCSNALPKLKI